MGRVLRVDEHHRPKIPRRTRRERLNMETETEFKTVQEVLDGAIDKFGGWSMSASEVIYWIMEQIETLEENK
jgi:hypothetical protein